MATAILREIRAKSYDGGVTFLISLRFQEGKEMIEAQLINANTDVVVQDWTSKILKDNPERAANDLLCNCDMDFGSHRSSCPAQNIESQILVEHGNKGLDEDFKSHLYINDIYVVISE